MALHPAPQGRLRVLAVMSLTLLAALAHGSEPPDNPSGPAPASQQDADAASADAKALRLEIRQQEERLRELERRLEADEAAQRAAAGANGAPAISPAASPNALLGSVGEDGIRLQSADGLNVVHLGGNVSVDYRYFNDSFDAPTADTWLVRKARLILEGQLNGMFDFRFMPDFGQGKSIIQDAWLDVRAAPWLVFTAGKFKAPVGLERLQLEQFARFIEASLTADLEPYRDLGGEIGGSLGGLVNYQIGAFDGAPDGGSTDGNSIPDANSSGKLTWNARVFALPFKRTSWRVLQGWGLGLAGTYVNDSGVATTSATTSLLASYKTTGQQPMFSYRGNTSAILNNATIARGIERRLVPQSYWYYGRVYVMGEYVEEARQVFRQVSSASSRAATLEHSAWQIQGGVFVTGEKEAYDAGAPMHEVGKGGLGAWEIVARYHGLRYDGDTFSAGSASFANPATAVRSARAAGIGLNWYLTRFFKVQLDFEVTRFEGGALLGDRPDERVLTSQFALTL
ncbi:MAG TPA: porin [Steroidobacteraceae bacterium]|nr:porin [Steroidobacteraceae bacterium]